MHILSVQERVLLAKNVELNFNMRILVLCRVKAKCRAEDGLFEGNCEGTGLMPSVNCNPRENVSFKKRFLMRTNI